MKTQNKQDLMELGLTEAQAERACALWALLSPGLKIKRNGRVDTAWGDKTVMGLFRSVEKVLILGDRGALFLEEETKR